MQAYPGRTAFLEFYERFELLQHQLVQASVKGQAIIGTAPSRGGNPTTGGGKKGMLDLPPPGHATEAEAKDACRTILESFLPHKFFQIGETRVSGGGFRDDVCVGCCVVWAMTAFVV